MLQGVVLVGDLVEEALLQGNPGSNLLLGLITSTTLFMPHILLGWSMLRCHSTRILFSTMNLLGIQDIMIEIAHPGKSICLLNLRISIHFHHLEILVHHLGSLV